MPSRFSLLDFEACLGLLDFLVSERQLSFRLEPGITTSAAIDGTASALSTTSSIPQNYLDSRSRS